MVHLITSYPFFSDHSCSAGDQPHAEFAPGLKLSNLGMLRIHFAFHMGSPTPWISRQISLIWSNDLDDLGLPLFPRNPGLQMNELLLFFTHGTVIDISWKPPRPVGIAGLKCSLYRNGALFKAQNMK